MTLPYSDTQLVNEAKPSECNVISDIPSFIRENREALNLLWAEVQAACVSIQLALGDNIVNVAGAGKVVLSAPAGVSPRVIGITGAAPGATVVFRISENMSGNRVTFADDGLSLFMDGREDAVLGADDFIAMHFCDASESTEFCLRMIDGAWTEVGRTQARYSPTVDRRFWTNVNDHGALVVKEI